MKIQNLLQDQAQQLQDGSFQKRHDGSWKPQDASWRDVALFLAGMSVSSSTDSTRLLYYTVFCIVPCRLQYTTLQWNIEHNNTAHQRTDTAALIDLID